MLAHAPILLIRHGEKEPNEEGITKIDPLLTSKGAFQALTTGAELGRNYSDATWNNANVVVSPYKRTMQTAILAMARKGWQEGQAPQLTLDPLISETLENENCIGTPKDELLAWIADDARAEISTAVHDAVQHGIIEQDELESILDNIYQLCDTLDQTKLENRSEQEWWPLGENGTYETPADAAKRMKQVQEIYAKDANAVLFSHSTFIAHSFMDLRPTKTFGQAAEGKMDEALAINAPCDVKLAGAYELGRVDGAKQGEVLSGMYDPEPVVDQALKL